MTFTETFGKHIILFDAPLGTRLQYEKGVQIPENFATYQYVDDPVVSVEYVEMYEGDIKVAQRYRMPILLNLPTLRASQHYFPDQSGTEQEVIAVNQRCYQFVDDIRRRMATPEDKVYIVAPIGPQHDAYQPELALSVAESEDYHAWQINALAATGVDVLNITVMNSVAEALGCANVASQTDTPYLIGFVVILGGLLLDGTPLHQAIDTIDSHVCGELPLGYLIFCTHPSIAVQTLAVPQPQYRRIKGIKANASCKPPAELATTHKALCDEPVSVFVKTLVALTTEHDWHLVGGCCGTSREHLEGLAKQLSF